MINLNLSIEKIAHVGPRMLPRLRRLGILTVGDLIRHFPVRYEDFSNVVPIGEITDVGPASAEGSGRAKQIVSIQGRITKIDTIRAWRRRLTITTAFVEDDTDSIRVVWFNQPFLQDTFKEGTLVSLSGKLAQDKRGLYLSSPAYERIMNQEVRSIDQDLKHTGRLVPIYPETEGVTSKYLRYLIKPIIEAIDYLPDPLPPEILARYHFPDYTSALKTIHFPEKIEDAQPAGLAEASAKRARDRFAFEELLLLQLRTLRDRGKMKSLAAPQIHFDKDLIADFVKSLPFTLTNDQRVSAFEILKDLDRPHPMNRLLNGDVGSGKTVVALMAAYQAVCDGFQVVFMAPTEILARQHFATIKSLLALHATRYTIHVGLLTGSEAKQWPSDDVTEEKISKKLLVKKIANGEISIVIGTHAVIQKNVGFAKLGLVIIDEQHRFGIAQRAKLVKRGINAELTRKSAESDPDDNKLLFENLTYNIRGALFEIKKQLGLGHKEIVYQKALEKELSNRMIPFEHEKRLDILYKGVKVAKYQPDFVVDGKIIVELKVLPFLGDQPKAQLWQYLKGSTYKVALLVNYGNKGLEIERMVYDKARISSASTTNSASGPQSSAYIPHLLSMTATPIPRTLALTVYGDLDVSLLKEKPKGRQEIITRVVSGEKRSEAYAFIEKQINEGRQIFVICPRIDPANSQLAMDNSQRERGYSQLAKSYRQSMWAEVKAVTEEFEKLSKTIFPHRRVAMLHGKLKPKEKEQIMLDFKENKYDMIVSTSVVEVGVDVPNATIMMIESAERFGLAQLHQFRGRVGRGAHQSYCFLFTTPTFQSGSRPGGAGANFITRRLKAMEQTSDGFKLAEMDLAIRGPGEFAGAQQSGIPDLAMASLTDIEKIKQARAEAQLLLTNDPTLQNHPLLADRLAQLQRVVHFE